MTEAGRASIIKHVEHTQAWKRTSVTVIALLYADTNPILIGDLLISAARPTIETVDLPTVGVLPSGFTPDGVHSIVGVQQKIVLINKEVALAWSGCYIYARSIISRLSSYLSKTTVTYESIRNFFDNLEPDIDNHLRIICLARMHKGWTYYGIGATQIETEVFGRCYLGGSGEGRIIQYIYSIDEIIRLSESDDVEGDLVIEEVTGVRRVLYHKDLIYRLPNVLSLINTMLGEELHRSSKFELLYGGGMEIAVLDQDGIRKLNDIVHAFFFYNPGKPDEVVTHRVMIHVDYWQDCTLLNRIAQHVKNKTELSTYIIPPPSSIDVAKSYIPNTERLFSCSWLCGQIILITDENKVLGVASVSVTEDDRGTFLKVERNERGIKVEITSQFMNLVKEKAMYYCARYPGK